MDSAHNTPPMDDIRYDDVLDTLLPPMEDIDVILGEIDPRLEEAAMAYLFGGGDDDDDDTIIRGGGENGEDVTATRWVANQKKERYEKERSHCTPQLEDAHAKRIELDENRLAQMGVATNRGGECLHQEVENYDWITCPPNPKKPQYPLLPEWTIREKHTPPEEVVDADGNRFFRVLVAERMEDTPPEYLVPEGFEFAPLEGGEWTDPAAEGGDKFWGGLTPHQRYLLTVDVPTIPTTPPEEVTWRETSEVTSRQWGGVNDDGPTTQKGLAE